MVKKTRILEFYNSNGSYSICLSNVAKQENAFECIRKVILFFANGSELFFGHYRTDGFNISNDLFRKYDIEIPDFFSKKGKYLPITKIQGRNRKLIRNELVVCCAQNSEETYNIFEKVFHYYLETIVFCPKVDWDTFVNSYANYMSTVTADYVLNGFTDFLFSYVDSGDFLITFDPTVYSPVMIRNKINMILLEVGVGNI